MATTAHLDAGQVQVASSSHGWALFQVLAALGSVQSYEVKLVGARLRLSCAPGCFAENRTATGAVPSPPVLPCLWSRQCPWTPHWQRPDLSSPSSQQRGLSFPVSAPGLGARCALDCPLLWAGFLLQNIPFGLNPSQGRRCWAGLLFFPSFSGPRGSFL